MMTGVNMVHVPYRGEAPAITDLLGGQVQVMFGNLPTSIEHVRTSRLRALAVTTAMRSPELPNVPTVSDFVPGFEAGSWWGVAAPKSTPAEIIERLNKAFNAALADPKVRTRLAELGTTPLEFSPGEFGTFVEAETEKWAKVIKFSGAREE